ncbi:hypothetical protein EYF80_030024 [Liparis tanakae]|uniref:Uncharacterized protein n=1 Tax=Liparis tanakae TaxID=230148 RepID=A0A4Z2H2E4_9TELE|nr:hypothetical protein EYF80_030024 [Liparis tanakae]
MGPTVGPKLGFGHFIYYLRIENAEEKVTSLWPSYTSSPPLSAPPGTGLFRLLLSRGLLDVSRSLIFTWS